VDVVLPLVTIFYYLPELCAIAAAAGSVFRHVENPASGVVSLLSYSEDSRSPANRSWRKDPCPARKALFIHGIRRPVNGQ